MKAALREFVRQRANNRCEYCLLPQAASSVPFEIDQVIPRQHRGKTLVENLAPACFYCNSSKGPNLTGIDPITGKLARLFHPHRNRRSSHFSGMASVASASRRWKRRNRWSSHFEWDGPDLVGKRAIGRVTVYVLAINKALSVALRASLLEE